MIETDRLVLYTLAPQLVALLSAGDLQGARALRLPYTIDETTFAEDKYVLGLRNAQLTADPSQEPWLYRVAVLRGTRQVIGRAGFHAPPDADGTVELGYSVVSAYRRQGFALEIARGLLTWGAAVGARVCLASVSPDNAASLATVRRLGFVKIGEQIDEIDGQEWVHSLPL